MRSEGTPHTLRGLDIDPGPPYAVFLQNTPLLADAVPRVGTLGWFALPRWGKGTMTFPIPRPCPPPGECRAIGLVCVAPLGHGDGNAVLDKLQRNCADMLERLAWFWRGRRIENAIVLLPPTGPR
jgi:hypothetical protein